MSTTLLTVGAGSYGPGTIPIPSTAIPSGFSQFFATWECASWTDTGSEAVVTLELSFDGGNTWSLWTASTYHGGARTRNGSGPLATAGMVAAAPQGTNVMVQGSIVITGSPLVTQGLTLVGE